MKKLLSIVLMILIFAGGLTAFADDGSLPTDFDWEAYTLDDLLIIQENLDAVVREKQRQWAIENGNRVIDLDVTDFTLYTTQTQTLTPTVIRVIEDAPETTRFLWTSSDDSVARVSAYGTVTAVGMGDAEITCTAADDEYIFRTATVHVVLPVTSVTVAEPRVTLLLSSDPSDAEALLSASVAPENAYCQDISWTSSNDDIASVDVDGKVTAHMPGTVTVTALSDDPFSAAYPKRAAVTVTVLQAVSEIELDQTAMTLNKNSYAVLHAVVQPDNASQKTLVWESSDPSVVRVSNGQITAVGTGEATVTCTASDGSGVFAESKITVIQMVTGILVPDVVGSLELLMNTEKTLVPQVNPADATNKDLIWKSSDPSIVTVSDNGTVRAVGGGRAVVTVEAVDGSGKSATVNIFVPTIGFSEKSVTVTKRTGLVIDIPFYGDPKAFEVKPTASPNFAIVPTWDAAKKVYHLSIIPSKAGAGTVYLKDNNNPASDRSFNLVIDHSAAYDTTSFPRPVYNDAMRYPERYKGTQISIYGRVVQKMQSGDRVALRVATAWSYDNVVYVTYNQSDIEIAVIEDDYITVYGTSTGVYTYSAIFGNEITIPSMEAERIFMGNN